MPASNKDCRSPERHSELSAGTVLIGMGVALSTIAGLAWAVDTTRDLRTHHVVLDETSSLGSFLTQETDRTGTATLPVPGNLPAELRVGAFTPGDGNAFLVCLEHSSGPWATYDSTQAAVVATGRDGGCRPT